MPTRITSGMYWTTGELARIIGVRHRSVTRYILQGALRRVVRVRLAPRRKFFYLIPVQDVSNLGGPRGRRKSK